MDYSGLLRRAWNLIWTHKWLIVLGIVAALAGGYGSSGGGGGNTGFQFDGSDFRQPPAEFDSFRDFVGELPGFETGEFDPSRLSPALGIGAALAIPLIILAVAVGVALWAVGTIARGGLVAGVDALESGGTSSFSLAWSAGWQKGWRLIGIGLLPAIPAVVLLVTGAGLGGALYSLSRMTDSPLATPAFAGLGATLAVIACVAGVAALVLGLLQTFAERACMLDDTDVFRSYGRGWEVLRANIGPAIVIFLIQVAIGIGVGLVMLLLSPILCLMCLVIVPLSLIVNGGVTAYFSTLWTLAWRQWTGRGAFGEPVVEAPPAV